MTTRARDLGLPFRGTPGPLNAITDVPGVLVGMTTLITGDGALIPGQGPVRTGVTGILPRGRQRPLRGVWAGTFRFNGNGEMTGVHWIEDGGYFVGPVCLTNTHSVGIAHHAAVRWMIDTYPEEFQQRHLWAMPVVAETYDGVLNDINGQHLRQEHVLDALHQASAGPVMEGNYGGGTGMIAYGFKGGTGTASRQISPAGMRGTVGVLVQANHGSREWLEIFGMRWEDRAAPPVFEEDRGSIIVVIATDLPLLPHQLKRVARRAALGIGRHGTVGGNSSGDLFLAFSTANPPPLPNRDNGLITLAVLPDDASDPIYEAVIQCVEEAVLNAMTAAQPMTSINPPGLVEAIPHDVLRDMAKRLKSREDAPN